MPGTFIPSSETHTDVLDWGSLRWVVRPDNTGARTMVVIDVTLKPGEGHNFHTHPQQEETIHVVDGIAEQWLEKEKSILKNGDAVFIPTGMVHATFNVGESDLKLLVVLGPAVGDEGYELVDVAEQAPWSTLRE